MLFYNLISSEICWAAIDFFAPYRAISNRFTSFCPVPPSLPLSFHGREFERPRKPENAVAMDSGNSSIANVPLKLNFSLPPRRAIPASIARGWSGTRGRGLERLFLPAFFAAVVAHSYPRVRRNTARIVSEWYKSASIGFIVSPFSFFPRLFVRHLLPPPPWTHSPNFSLALLSSSVLFPFRAPFDAVYKGAGGFIRILLDCRDRFH